MKRRWLFAWLGSAALLVWVGHGDRDRADLDSSSPVANHGERIARAGATLRPVAGTTSAEARDPVPTLNGVAAFRELSDDFALANEDAVREHMEREKLTRAETLELTFFALVASESLDWETVEQLTNHPIEAEARRQAWVQMQQRSRQMREELQTLVQRGAGEEERWEAIDRIESDYLSDYYRLTGMSPELLDQLLWLAVQGQNGPELAAAMAPNAPVAVPAGASCVRRDPENPTAPPIPVPCPM